LRQALWPALLPSRMARGALVGEDAHLAVDTIDRTEGLVARFLPLRGASAAAPLLIALAVAPASWVSAVIMLATLVPFVLGLVLAGGLAARRARAQHAALTRASGLFVDRIAHLPLIVASGAEERVGRQLAGATQDVARRTMAVLAIAFASNAILEFFAALCVALVAVYCGFALLGLLPFPAPEHLTLARAFYTLALAPEFYLGMRRLAAAYHDKQTGEAALEALDTAMAALPDAPPTVPAPARLRGQDVVIAYPDGTRIGPLAWDWPGPGLHAVTGATGSGKSSLLLALGQAPLAQGQILGASARSSPARSTPPWAGPGKPWRCCPAACVTIWRSAARQPQATRRCTPCSKAWAWAPCSPGAMGWTPRSTIAAPASPGANAAGWAWPARSCRAGRSCCSMNPPPISIPPAPLRCAPCWRPWRAIAW
jgi:ATP-binding cassette subfamily C protein CydD